MSFRLFRSYLALQLAAIAVFAFLPADGWTHTLWQVGVGWTSAAFVVAGMRRHRPAGATAWYLFGAGVFLNSTGILVAGIMARIFNVIQEPQPADAFWLALYPGLVTGMGLLVRRRTVGRDWSTLVDTVTISTGLGLLSWVFIIRPQAIDPQLHLLARATVAAYPVSDLVVLAMIVRLLIGGGIRSTAFRLMVCALLGFLASDIGWAVYSHLGITAPLAVQRVFEIGSLLGYTLVGAAAAHPSVREVALPAPARHRGLSPLLLGGLTVASLIAPSVLIFEALRREITDGVAIALCSAVLFLLVVIRMAQLLRRVEQHTRELAERNRSVRRVLDTVNEGLLTVSRDGWLAQEHSAIIDTWFPPLGGERIRFVDYVRPIDEEFAAAFALGHEALLEGTLPPELCLAQLPGRLRSGPRQFRVNYLPITDEGERNGLLVIINEVTAQLQLAQQEAEQRELLAVFQRFTRDRAGCLTFFDEGTQLIERAVWASEDRAARQRVLHTLKGNARLAGLNLIAELCHQAEDELEELADGQVTPAILTLRARWMSLAQSFRELVGDGRLDAIELPARALDELCQELDRGLPSSAASARLASWRCEPVERSLERLAEHARALTQQLGKGEAIVEIECAGEVRLDPRRWAPLWAELVHVVRNAVDHGFETQEERRTLAKRPQPRLRLAATLGDGQLTVEIEDDGRGIDWPALERAARERGVAVGGDRLDLVLAPGVSSRAEVSATRSRRGHGRRRRAGPRLRRDAFGDQRSGARHLLEVLFSAGGRDAGGGVGGRLRARDITRTLAIGTFAGFGRAWTRPARRPSQGVLGRIS